MAKNRTRFDSPEKVEIPEGLKFAMVFFGAPDPGSFEWKILKIIPYERTCHPRHDDKAKGRMLVEQPEKAICFKAFARKTSGEVIEACPVHYYDGETSLLADALDDNPDNADLNFISDNYPLCDKVVRINDRFYPIEQRGSQRGGYISPVISKMHEGAI